MKGFIYKITNRVNNKVYIGQTHFTVEHRFKQHIKNFNIEHRKQPLYNAFAKYGIENFVVETIEEVECSKLNEREMYWIAYYDSFKNGYNANLGGNGNLYSWTDSQYEEIKSLYLSGFTLKKISELYEVSATTISGILKSLKVKIRRNPMDMNNYEAQELIKDYQIGFTLTTLAKRYNTDRETVKRFLISKGVPIRKRHLIIDDKEAQNKIVEDFLNGIPYNELEKKYHTDTRTIKRILTIHGINIKAYRGLRQTIKGAFCLTDEQCLEAIKQYNDNIPVKTIAKNFNIDVSTVYELLKRYHVKCERYNRSKSVQTLTTKVEG